MHMQIMKHTAVNGSVHTGCKQYQKGFAQICAQICLRLLCEWVLRQNKRLRHHNSVARRSSRIVAPTCAAVLPVASGRPTGTRMPQDSGDQMMLTLIFVATSHHFAIDLQRHNRRSSVSIQSGDKRVLARADNSVHTDSARTFPAHRHTKQETHQALQALCIRPVSGHVFPQMIAKIPGVLFTFQMHRMVCLPIVFLNRNHSKGEIALKQKKHYV